MGTYVVHHAPDCEERVRPIIEAEGHFIVYQKPSWCLVSTVDDSGVFKLPNKSNLIFSVQQG